MASSSDDVDSSVLTTPGDIPYPNFQNDGVHHNSWDNTLATDLSLGALTGGNNSYMSNSLNPGSSGIADDELVDLQIHGDQLGEVSNFNPDTQTSLKQIFRPFSTGSLFERDSADLFLDSGQLSARRSVDKFKSGNLTVGQSAGIGSRRPRIHSLSHQSSASSLNSMYSSASVSSKRGERITGGYQCSQCTQSFDVPSDLRHHERKHLAKENRKYACHDCGERFLYPKDVKRHRKRAHPGVGTPQDAAPDEVPSLDSNVVARESGSIPDLDSRESIKTQERCAEERTRKRITELVNEQIEQIRASRAPLWRTAEYPHHIHDKLTEHEQSLATKCRLLNERIYQLERTLHSHGIEFENTNQWGNSVARQSETGSHTFDDKSHKPPNSGFGSAQKRAKGWFASLQRYIGTHNHNTMKVMFQCLADGIDSVARTRLEQRVYKHEAHLGLETACTYFAYPESGGLSSSEMEMMKDLLGRTNR